MLTDILKVDFFAWSKFCAIKSVKMSLKITQYVWNMKNKTVKEFKIRKFLVYACKSQDFAQSQTIFARSHNLETMTFRNSGYALWKRRKKYANYISYGSLVSFVGLFYFCFCWEIFFDIFFFFFLVMNIVLMNNHI